MGQGGQPAAEDGRGHCQSRIDGPCCPRSQDRPGRDADEGVQRIPTAIHAGDFVSEEDVPELARFLLQKLSQKQGRELKISDGAIRLLVGYHWPGNVRELENCLERASIMTETGLIDRDAIMLNTQENQPAQAMISRPVVLPQSNEDEMDERQRLIAALEKSGWVQAKAARLLGMTPRQIAYRIQIMNINMRRI